MLNCPVLQAVMLRVQHAGGSAYSDDAGMAEVITGWNEANGQA